MNYFALFIACTTFIFGGCQIKKQTVETPLKENFNCTSGSMKRAWYEHGIDEAAPPIKKLNNGFLIVVDPDCKATNFISFDEDYWRNQPPPLEVSSKKNKQKALAERALSIRHADSVHRANNQGKNQVWIINNTPDTVSIQMQDWSYICILQALTKAGQWRPIQYWRFSWCGNSYYEKDFPPQTANSFVITLPGKGDYETRLRFKLLGVGKFYYSNEFTGKIDYCDFVEDSTAFRERNPPKPNYKLDTLISLTKFLPALQKHNHL